MDVLKFFGWIAAVVLNACLELAWHTFKLVVWLLWWAVRKIFIKPPPKLPTGEKLIAYTDGKKWIELTHKNGKTRLVPDTPEKRQEIAEYHRQNPRGMFRRLKG